MFHEKKFLTSDMGQGVAKTWQFCTWLYLHKNMGVLRSNKIQGAGSKKQLSHQRVTSETWKNTLWSWYFLGDFWPSIWSRRFQPMSLKLWIPKHKVLCSNNALIEDFFGLNSCQFLRFLVRWHSCWIAKKQIFFWNKH